MTDQSIFGRFQANDVPYVAFRDDNEDLEDEFSDSMVLRPTASTSSRTAPSTFQNFTTSRQHYQHLPENDEIEDSDPESNEAPASLIKNFKLIVGRLDLSLALPPSYWNADNNPTTSHQGPNNKPQQRLDAHNITNRIMRQENYLIALFNKDMLDLTIPIPFFRQKNFLTKTLEWNLRYCIINHVFNDQGQVRRLFVKDTKGVQRERLTRGLRRRFIFMGILNLIFAPFIVVYLLIYFFFRYFEEYRNNPQNISLRQWTPFARWKFREFNELPHLFNQRLDKSYKQANKYIDQFPKEKTALLAKFISFIASSLTAVLLIASIIDSEVFLGFEISPGRTVFFYLGLLVPVVAISRGMSAEDHVVFEPTVRLKKVVEHTHYSPDNWKGKLDTDDHIIDFFREFTVHVDGLGYVCSFAVFDFKRHGNVKYGAPAEVENEYYLSKDGKMEKSFLNFKANHPDWEPTDPAGSLYLSRLNFSNQIHSERHNSIRSAPIDSILKNNRRSMNNVHFAGHSSPDSSQEGHFASDLSGSYLLTGTKNTNLSESNEPDRPRHHGVGIKFGDPYRLSENMLF
ncbi:19241_t:CDS:10 [Dentiscutata erythropus]|uniref:Autophagy-related protein 9 n=1 Tax=Dentiscutata erythropus TaxID=1348616 RepID=A0A9N8WG26_9GLOM|nr:19241_t:CDS:10 [Dentiscutata erythropus]